VKLTVHIDGKDIAVEKGTPLLQAARKAGIDIPALCSHDALEPYGSCRLCLVEVSRGPGGRARLTTSCNYPVLRDGETVSTRSERVLHARRIVMELLLARCPGSEPVRALARSMGIEDSRYPSPVPSHLAADAPAVVDCILCGLCVRACAEAIGASAISFADRGPNRHVASPFDVNAEACIGCGACASVCPTGVIRMDDTTDGVRHIAFIHTDVGLRRCERCGSFVAPEAQLGAVKEKAAKLKAVPSKEGPFAVCPACRKRELAAELARVPGTTGRAVAV
jgi:NADH dehydrogenase/NADH:ubiquinone oxidoreductase subunit G